MALGLALALLIGLALGLFGGGGSILAVPLLTYAFEVPPEAAIAASLVIVGVTSAAALVGHVRNGLVVFRIGLPFGTAAMLGAYAGGSVTRFIPDSLLLLGFGLMMLITAAAMLRVRPDTPNGGHAAAAAPAKLALAGLGVGGVAGLLGAGGGFLIVPAMGMLGGMAMPSAVATSLLVISMQSLAGVVGHWGHASIPWQIVAPVTAVATLGSIGGGSLVQKTRPEALRRGFAWFVILVALLVVSHDCTH